MMRAIEHRERSGQPDLLKEAKRLCEFVPPFLENYNLLSADE